MFSAVVADHIGQWVRSGSAPVASPAADTAAPVSQPAHTPIKARPFSLWRVESADSHSRTHAVEMATAVG